MADKLYPPTIAGTLPSFYYSGYGTTKLVVPFSMNKIVSVNEVRDFSLRIKTASTDILYGVLETHLQDKENPRGSWNRNEKANLQVSFEVPDNILYKLSIGQFYKIQLAYIDQNGLVGHYSTVSIMKYTAKPEVTISGFSLNSVNTNKTEYIGEYKNLEDPTEKVYQYKFDLYNESNTLLESSGWLLHNSYEDSSLAQSIDRYSIRYAFVQDKRYKIQYTIKTNNNLIISSHKYLVMDSKTINPEIKAILSAKLDYNNACVDLHLIGERDTKGKEYAITGEFILSRSSSLDNFSSWLPISKFNLTGELPSAFLFRDYTIEQGAIYLYSLQQRNDFDIYSNRLLTEYVHAYFEDAYLFDGERQLRIRFNPKVSSFKTVVLESKKTTIGSKFPFIFRNGSVEYKEFPINGLISYMMDNDEFFLSKKNDLYIDHGKDTTDITDENILLERLFKLEVLDWLNDGKIKLFKSPQEGNYIVRLMNVSLSPIDNVSRMLHNFSCQATEIADFTSENLTKYGLVNAEKVMTYQMRWQTIVLQEKQLELKKKNESIYGKDLLNDYEAYYVKFVDTIQGTTFKFIDHTGQEQIIMIGATGAYEMTFEKPITKLQLVGTSDYQRPAGVERLLEGSVTFSIKSASLNKFDSIEYIDTSDIPVYQTFGPSENILEYYNNIRRQVSRIYYAKFTKLEVRDVYHPLFGEITNTYTGDRNPSTESLLTGVYQELIASTPDKYWIYDIQTMDQSNQIIHHYYRYYDGAIYEFPHFSTNFPNTKDIKFTILNEYTIYYTEHPKTKVKTYYRVNGDKLIQDDLLANTNYPYYTLNQSDLSPHVIYRKRYYDRNNVLQEKYYKFTGSKLIPLDNYSTEIVLKKGTKRYAGTQGKKSYDGLNKQYNEPVDWVTQDLILDVKDKEVIMLPELEIMPEAISIGSGVSAELGMQIKSLSYNVEKLCFAEDGETKLKDLYDEALLRYVLARLGLEKVDKKEKIEELKYANTTYYIYKDGRFEIISSREIYDPINKNQFLLYNQSDIVFYHNSKTDLYRPVSTPANLVSEAQLDSYYKDLLDIEAKFISAIEELREAQENR